jgi:hypothetical protein
VYFLMGVGIGAYGIERGLQASEGKLARRWMLWRITALVAFGAAAAIAIASLSATSSPQVWETIGGVSFHQEMERMQFVRRFHKVCLP